jgi:TPR repeat protein
LFQDITTGDSRPILARALGRLSITLHQLESPDYAVAIARDQCDLYRRLADEYPSKFRVPFADSLAALTSLTILEPSSRTVLIEEIAVRRLIVAEKGEHWAGLAVALTILAGLRLDDREYDISIELVREAVDIICREGPFDSALNPAGQETLARIPDFIRRMSNRLVWEGEIRMASEALQIGFRLDPRPDFACDIAWSARELGEKSTAKQWYAIAANTGDPLAMLSLGALYHEEGDIDNARQWFSKSASQGNADAAHNLGYLSLREGDPVAADTWLHRAIEGGNSTVLSKDLAFLCLEMGRLLYAKGATKRAEFWLRAAAEGDEIEGAYLLGSFLSQTGREEESAVWLDRAARNGSTDALLDLGGLAYFGERYNEAERLWQRAAASGDIRGSINLGALYHSTGDLDQAEQQLRQAATSGWLQPQVTLAMVLVAKGRKAEAESLIEAVSESLRAKPDSKLEAMVAKIRADLSHGENDTNPTQT